MSNPTAKKLHDEGVTLFRKGKSEAALQKLEEALAQAADEASLQAAIYNDIGVVRKQQEDYPAAHAALDKAMEYFAAADDKRGQAQNIGNRAAVYEAEGALEEAVDHYKQAATMLEEEGESEMAMYVWQAISRLRTKQGQYIAAIGAYEEGVDNMPERSFKRKVLEKILKAPGKLLGLPDQSDEPDEDK